MWYIYIFLVPRNGNFFIVVVGEKGPQKCHIFVLAASLYTVDTYCCNYDMGGPERRGITNRCLFQYFYGEE